MTLEAFAARPGSTSNVSEVDIYTLHSPSGSTGQALVGMLAEGAPTLGASSVSHARARWMVVLVGALASSVSFAADPAMAQVLFPERVTIPAVDAQDSSRSDGSAEFAAPVMGRILDQVVAAVEQEPVEDGVSHPAEPWVARLLHQYGAAQFHAEMFEKGRSAPLVASLLRLLGRQKPEPSDVRDRILGAALASSSIEIRDAAVQAAELWGDRTAIDMLRGHVEENQWLADYIGRVLEQIPG
ncbi:MAG TPA: hypothetical protein VMT79_02815 [Candidatus Binatia bacterium]|nr:hypothetical protein [Candidatus Binatia bacterium]